MLSLWIVAYFLESSFLLPINCIRPVDDITVLLRSKPDYNLNAYPTEGTDTPTLVSIQMYIEGMSSFRAQTMDFHVDIYFQQKWIDHRLAHNNSKRILVKHRRHFDQIWHPDLYFANARTAEFHDVTAPNFLLWIYPNGTIWYDCRISLTVICMQNLAKYPLDSQRCTLRILSYAYDIKQLLIDWNSAKPIETNEEIRMPDMRLKEILPGLQNSTYATGVWSCATAEFYVNREIMHHILQSYLPTSLIVVISWFNFWLDVEAVPGRVSLSITTLLTLATQSSAARFALPQASYVKAIDVWMGACMTFVFSAMIEFTVVNFCVRCKPKKSRLSRTRSASLSNHMQQLLRECGQDERAVTYEKTKQRCFATFNADDELKKRQPETRGMSEPHENALNKYMEMFPSNITFSSRKRRTMEQRISVAEENRKYAQMIDRRSRIYFPFSFIIFNAIYWTYYVYFAEDD